MNYEAYLAISAAFLKTDFFIACTGFENVWPATEVENGFMWCIAQRVFKCHIEKMHDKIILEFFEELPDDTQCSINENVPLSLFSTMFLFIRYQIAALAPTLQWEVKLDNAAIFHRDFIYAIIFKMFGSKMEFSRAAFFKDNSANICAATAIVEGFSMNQKAAQLAIFRNSSVASFR